MHLCKAVKRGWSVRLMSEFRLLVIRKVIAATYVELFKLSTAHSIRHTSSPCTTMITSRSRHLPILEECLCLLLLLLLQLVHRLSHTDLQWVATPTASTSLATVVNRLLFIAFLRVGDLED